MTDTSPEELRAWVQRWKVAGEVLARLRREELRTVSTPEALEALAPAFQAALQLPLRPSSGLVIQQAWFAKLR